MDFAATFFLTLRSHSSTNGSFNATPRRVFQTYQRWQRELELEPVEFLRRCYRELMRSAMNFISKSG